MATHPTRRGRPPIEKGKISAVPAMPAGAAAADEDDNPELTTQAAINAASDTDDSTTQWACAVFRPADRKKGETQEGWVFDCSVEELQNVRRRLLEEYGAGHYRV